MDAEQRFARLAGEFAGAPGLTLPGEGGRRRFGSTALKVNGSIFAMLTGGRLVVKLPEDRVRWLIEQGSGAPFDSGKGIPMKEWVSVVDDDEATWRTLARESLEFVRSRSSRG